MARRTRRTRRAPPRAAAPSQAGAGSARPDGRPGPDPDGAFPKCSNNESLTSKNAGFPIEDICIFLSFSAEWQLSSRKGAMNWLCLISATRFSSTFAQRNISKKLINHPGLGDF